MANRSKLEKMKSILKQWRDYSKLGKSGSSLGSNPSEESCDFGNPSPEEGYQTVYVGKSRRRYVVSEEHLRHPLMRVLIHKSEGDDFAGCVIISCEVVLFEHLLWMLKNAEPEAIQNDSLEELVEFYACSS